MNDSIFKSKDMVDAINNSFFKKFYQNLSEDKNLMNKFSAEYKDYKSLRIRLNATSPQDKKDIENSLQQVFNKTTEDFAKNLKDQNVLSTISNLDDKNKNIYSWFLAGIGDNSTEANMSSRGARNRIDLNNQKPAKITHFKENIQEYIKLIDDIENIQKSFTLEKDLIKLGILDVTNPQNAHLSKETINILRKIKASDFSNHEGYILELQKKFLNIFGSKPSEQQTNNIVNYFNKVDSISPPVFVEERTIINLAEAKKGIVSIDFTGLGTENIYEQMKALSSINQKLKNSQKVEDALYKLETAFDTVTEKMNKAKENFKQQISYVNMKEKTVPKFSGDDGIHMPTHSEFDEADKVHLIHQISQSDTPSKYRITFVNTTYQDGQIIPKEERSLRIVRAETLEKDIRSKITGHNKIPANVTKELNFGIDYIAEKQGGVFNLILGASKAEIPSASIELLKKSILESLDPIKNEKFGRIIFEQ